VLSWIKGFYKDVKVIPLHALARVSQLCLAF
jgi:hypothetical protein